MDIEHERLETQDPGLDEEEEFHTLNLITLQDAKLPRLDLLIERNKNKADMVLTDIQNSMGTKVIIK